MSYLNKNIRKISFDILYDVFCNNKLLNIALNEKLRDDTISVDNKAFIKRECTGTIENLESIDELINKYSKVKTKKLNKDILVILRLAVYELCYMDRVPNFATINESVEIIKKSKNSRLSGYVNAVLRNIIRNENLNVNLNDTVKKKCYFRICNNYEDEVIKELSTKNIFYKKYDGALNFKYAKVYYVDKYKNILDTDGFRNGYVMILDASSIYLADKLAYFIKEREKNISKTKNIDAVSTMKLLDVCASPGGKILSLIDLIANDYNCFYAEARDVSEEKILKIQENVDRLKISNINLAIKDATIYDKLDDDKYDVVILDVPCTGLGVIGKKPDIKLNYNEEKRDSLVKVQRKILDSTKHYVKKGGIISYSTCTETIEENENNIKYFLDNNKDFEKIFEKRINRNDENESDGFYMCFMKRI